MASIQVNQGQRSIGVLYQDITALLSGDTNEHELYYFTFEMATECGWRSSEHPVDRDFDTHFTHRVVAYVEWYDDTTIAPTTDLWEKSDTAITITSLEAFNTSVELTPFCLRTYRPLEASQARIKLVVEGFMPNDNIIYTDPNFVQFDNVAFFKAPEIEQLVGEWHETEPKSLTYLSGGATNLSMTLTVNAHETYILFEGELTNDDPDKLRALDFGFALPIYAGTVQQVEWFDDNHVSMSVTENSLEQTIPYRMVGPADMRLTASTDFVFPDGKKQHVEKNYRGRGLNISAYPFSAITITKNNITRGLSFGEYLPVTYPPISHIGYRVENPGPYYFAYKGRYYVEFSIGLLDSNTSPGMNTGRFSFILFRSDIEQWTETQAFREAAQKYQQAIFPGFFTRPTHCETDDWLFGGGSFSGETDATAGFNFRPNDFGFRYTRKKNLDTEPGDTQLTALIDYWDDPYHLEAKNIDILVNDHPWVAGFVNERSGSPDMDSVNVYSVQTEDRIPDHVPVGQLWRNLYLAQQENKLLLPGLTDPFILLTRDLTKDDNDPTSAEYFFPVLLADPPIGQNNLLSQQLGNLTDAYTSVSIQSEKGLGGVFLDNMFVAENKGPYLDVLADSSPPISRSRQEAFVSAEGTLTYSLSHFKPAISQLPLNAAMVKAAKNLLDEIDEDSGGQYEHGEGIGAPGDTKEEILTGNINAPYFGGSKYGLIHADMGGFEGNPVLSFNNGSQAFDFRRTLARAGNMPHKLLKFPCIHGMRTTFDTCQNWKDLWGDSDDSWEKMYEQIVNEAIWIDLAWGFHPGITVLLPVDESVPGDLDEFVEEHIRGKYTGSGGDLGYTAIYKELHLAGWHPINNAVTHVDGVPLPLFVERFGDTIGWGDENAKYFTVLNNDTLSYTLVQMTEDEIAGTPSPEIYFEDIPDIQTLDDTIKCSLVQNCEGYPSREDADDHFILKRKTFHLEIHDPVQFGLHNGNLYAKQLVSNADDAEVCNWPLIQPAEFDDGTLMGRYSIVRKNSSIIIGGARLGTTQTKITLEDKALLVFKIWPSLTVNNGTSGECRDGSGEGSWTESSRLWSYFEMYGDGWQRLDSDAGYGGNLDLVQSSSPGACVNYKFTIGESGRYSIRVHLPVSPQTPAPARYKAYVLDYLEGPVGPAPPGDPVWSHLLDPGDSDTYNQEWDEEGFVEIGAIDVTLTEPALVTVVIRLSGSGSGTDRTAAGSGYLLADAVKLVPEDEE